MDSDFHKILLLNIFMNPNRKIENGNKVWSGSRVIINKGASIPSNSVIAGCSVIRRRYYQPNSLLVAPQKGFCGVIFIGNMIL